jgi:cyclophilin family peptidyl-prolyl cis-trans isomerase
MSRHPSIDRFALAMFAIVLLAAAPACTSAEDKSKQEKGKPVIDDKALPQILLQTSKGDVVLELYEDEAPNTVANFVNLVEKGYYDGLTFHRVIDEFMAQGGCPEGTGTGGPGYNIKCECVRKDHRKHERGVISMAHAGRDTGGSQFFINFVKTPHLDGKHTVFGHVVKGMDAIDKFNRTARLQARDDQVAGRPRLEPRKVV